MRHPLLRILIALLVGVIAPLCCCQAAAFAGGACLGGHVAAPEANSCCGGGADGAVPESSSDRPQNPSHDRPDRHQPFLPGECPSCPSCQGTSGGTGVNAAARLPAFEQQWNALATFALAVLWTMEAPEALVAPRPPGWAHCPPHLKANRDAQRWHCALLV